MVERSQSACRWAQSNAELSGRELLSGRAPVSSTSDTTVPSTTVLTQILVAPLSARIRRSGRDAEKSYLLGAMIYAFDIDMRIARLCLHAGRLHSGV